MTTEYLKLKQDNCRNCYRCIRSCPLKAINFAENRARIIEAECMLCGRCFVVCPQKAKEIRTDVPAAKGLLASGNPVHASIAPSFAAYFGGSGKADLEKALRRLGFAGAGETALGATLVKRRYDELVRLAEQSVIISSCCHSITLMLRKHFPEALGLLAPVVSPMQAHCASIKAEHPGVKTVFIGPCISKKAEAEEYPGSVDCVLTFDELASWFEEAGVSLETEPARASGAKTTAPRAGGDGRARIFPVAGGILRSMERPNPDYTYVAVDGLENCVNAVRDILSGKIERCFIEMSACSGSCIGGPVMGRFRPSPVTSSAAVNAIAGAKDFPVRLPAAASLARTFEPAARRGATIPETAIRDVLRKIGKTKPEHELNCGSCGYDTCRDKAAAVVLGKADISMCLPYLKEKAESFSDTIITHTPNGIVVLNEALVVQQINEAACRILNIRTPRDILGSKVVRVLDPDIFLEARDSGRPIYDRMAYLAEYGRHVRQTVIHDAGYHVCILIMRDVTAEETARAETEERNRRTAEVTDEVVEKQMRVVQEIASLLGETAAETKVALTKLKRSLDLE